MPQIHPTAIVAPEARLAQDVVVGPYCVVGEGVELGPGVSLQAHVVVVGRTTIGAGTRIFPFASIGQEPQDLKYRSEPSSLTLGCRNTIREYVTMNPGTEGGGMVTRVGSDCLFMVGTHIAHDCQIADNVIMANNTTLGGHVVVEEYAFLGGICAVHQFVRIGRAAMIGGVSGVEADVIPFGSVIGNRARLAGLNVIGLKRRGFDKAQIGRLHTAFHVLFRHEGVFAQRLAAVRARYGGEALVAEVLKFIDAPSHRGLIRSE